LTEPDVREVLSGVTHDFFERVPCEQHPTSIGPVELPILYTEASQFGVFFRVDLASARAVIGETRTVEPWPILGRAVAAIYVWEYRDSTIGGYGEVGVGIQARRKGASPSLVRLGLDMGAQDDQGIWVVNLPVTSEGARAAGVELWGYPKYVTPIATTFGPSGAHVRLGDELELSIGALGGPTLRAMPVVTYTERGGRILRTRIDVDHRARWGRGAATKLSVLGDGPVARTVRALGIDRTPAIAAFRTDAFRGRLPAGVDRGPAALASETTRDAPT